jgi:hypothetical protein
LTGPSGSIPDLLSPGGRAVSAPTGSGSAGRSSNARGSGSARSGHSAGHSAQTAEEHIRPSDGDDEQDSDPTDGEDRDGDAVSRLRHPLWGDGERASSDGLLGLLGALGEQLQDLN